MAGGVEDRNHNSVVEGASGGASRLNVHCSGARERNDLSSCCVMSVLVAVGAEEVCYVAACFGIGTGLGEVDRYGERLGVVELGSARLMKDAV